MSAPLKLNSAQLRRLSDFLEALTEATNEETVRLGAYGSVSVSVDGVALDVQWDDEQDQYVIDDRVGS